MRTTLAVLRGAPYDGARVVVDVYPQDNVPRREVQVALVDGRPTALRDDPGVLARATSPWVSYARTGEVDGGWVYEPGAAPW